MRSHRQRGDGCLPWTGGGAGCLLVPAGTLAKLTNKAHSKLLAACPRKAAVTGPRSLRGPSWEQAAGAAQVTDMWARGQAAGARTGHWWCGLAAFGDAPWELWALEGPGHCGRLCHPWFPEHWPRHERLSAILGLACPGLRASPLGAMGRPCMEAWSRVGQAGPGHWGSRGQRPCPGMWHGTAPGSGAQSHLLGLTGMPPPLTLLALRVGPLPHLGRCLQTVPAYLPVSSHGPQGRRQGLGG